MKPTHFRVKPDPDKPSYYNVFIFPTRADMHEFWRWQVDGGYCGPTPQEKRRARRKDFGAQASWRDTLILDKSRWRVNPCIGQVIFYSGFVGAGIVAHEMAHAALYYVAARKRLLNRRDRREEYRLNKREDEKMASACGEMSRQFWVHYYRHEARRKNKR